MSRTYGKAQDLIDFTRASNATALRRVKYGAELVTNGTFDSDISGWVESSATTSVSESGVEVTTTSTNKGGISQAVSLTIGKVYVFSVEQSGVNDAIVQLGSAGFSGETYQNIAVSGGLSFAFIAGYSSTYISLRVQNASAGQSCTFDNVSVKEVTFDTSDGDLILFNHPANIPRIEYDADSNLLGLLVEESRTNLIPYSDFSSGWDQSSATVTANSVSSPDGQTNGAEVDLLTTGGFFYDTISVTAGTVYTWSWYAKAGTATAWILAVYDETNTNFVTREEYTLTDGESVGNGWYRHSYTFTAPAGCSSARVYPIRGLLASGGVPETVGTTYLFGAQVEAGSFPTSYIPTSGSTATRSADVASLSTSAFGYRQDEGSVIVEAKSKEVGVNRLYALTEDGGIQDAVYSYAGSSGHLIIRANNVTEANLDAGTFVADAYSKLAATYKTNDSAVTLDGGAVQTDAGVNLPTTVNTLFFGASATTANYLNGHIKSLKYYPRRLTNAQLQELTS